MPKHQDSAPGAGPRDIDEEAAVRELTGLALECARKRADHAELARAVRRHLLDRHDDVLYDALEEARSMADGAYALLRETVEESSATVLLRRDGPDMEINAFAIPLFVRSTGGLKADEGFADDAAYDALTASLGAGGLESPRAKVVLIRHWYDFAELDRITYCGLHALVREVAGAIGHEKKARPMPLLEASMSGWDGAAFGPQDEALELRFLLGFAYKRADDPFYAVPADEAKADAWFDARMQRYRAWTEGAAPLVKRLLAAPGRALDVNFLYQDLFFGAKQQGADELFVLQVMADAGEALAARGLAAQDAQATVAQIDVEGEPVVRAELHGPGGETIASFDKLLDDEAHGPAAIGDLADAFATLGVAVEAR